MYWHLFKTQKARGIAWLCLKNHVGPLHNPGYMPALGQHFGIGTILVWPHDKNAFNKLPCFARPCPVTPRHGFVESRVVASISDVAKIVAETYGEEKGAEIVVMPKFSGAYSGVITPDLCTLGHGNAGVTGGQGVIIRIPLPRPDVREWNRLLAGNVGPNKLEVCEEGEYIYLEVVENAGVMRMVQARPGPEVDATANFVPKEVEVTTVYLLDGEPSLLEWEKQMKEMKGVAGFVVWAPNSTLSSHYAVHCIQNEIPFLTGKVVPKVGEVLKKAAPPKINKVGRLAFKREMETRLAKRVYLDGSGARNDLNAVFAISVAHAQSFWGNSGIFAKLRARGLLHLLRYTAVACIGEARHFYNSGPGRPTSEVEAAQKGFKAAFPSEVRPAMLPWKVIASASPKVALMGRQTLYDTLFPHSLEKLMEWVASAEKDLRSPGWCPGMGGDKWASAAQNCLETWEALQTFQATPDKKNWRRLCQKWNNLAFSVHNGGKIVNKWCSDADVCALYPGIGFASTYSIVVGEVSGVNVQPPEEEEEVEEEEPIASVEVVEVGSIPFSDVVLQQEPKLEPDEEKKL